jgi:hypothetical protein
MAVFAAISTQFPSVFVSCKNTPLEVHSPLTAISHKLNKNFPEHLTLFAVFGHLSPIFNKMIDKHCGTVYLAGVM